MLEKISKILGVSEEAIKNFSEESAVNIISNTYNDQAASIQYNFNPNDKIVVLYERLLKSEKEKNELLQQLLAKNNISQ